MPPPLCAGTKGFRKHAVVAPGRRMLRTGDGMGSPGEEMVGAAAV
jgi:hypothetical protein